MRHIPRMLTAVIGIGAISAGCTARFPRSPAASVPLASVLPAADSPLQPFRERILQLVESDSVPSMAVAVYANGVLLWSEAVGFADRENEVRATPRTVYGLGSLSKSITGTAVMQLADHGLIDLDTPVNRYLDGAKVQVQDGNEQDLTVRRLLSMTGGIPHYVRNYWLDESQQPPTAEHLIRDYGVSVSAPGTRFNYSNLAYGIAERMIESVSGQSYAEYMKANVFDPIGMESATVRRDPANPLNALPYHRGDTALAYWFTDPEAGAGIQASLLDLVRYGQFHLRASSPHSPVVPGDSADPIFDYVLGWGILNVGDGHRILISDGNVFGATSNLQLFPKENAMVLVITNSSVAVGIIESLAFGIASVVAPEAARLRDALFTSSEWPPAAFREEPFQEAGPWTGHWVGTVRTPEGPVPIAVTVDDSARVWVSTGTDARMPARDLLRVGETLEGRVDVRLPTGDTEEYAHNMRFSLVLNAGRLIGTVSAWATHDRSYFVLPFFAELERAPGGDGGRR